MTSIKKMLKKGYHQIVGKKTGMLLTYILLFDVSFVFLYPFLYMISTSLKSYQDIINITVKWIPREISIINYKIAWEAVNFIQSGSNTVFITLITTFAHCIVCSFIGYGFARFSFPTKKIWFAIVILSIIVPIQTIIIPTYLTYVKMGMANSYLPIIFPAFLGYGLKGGLFIFLFRQFFIKLPKSLEEAASIDGSNPIKTYWKIALPSSASTLVVCVVLSIVWHWNDYFEPSIYLNNPKQWLLPQMLPEMYNLISSIGKSTDKWQALLQFKYHAGVAMAGTVLSTLPIIAMYLVMQRKFMEGVERTGLVE